MGGICCGKRASAEWGLKDLLSKGSRSDGVHKLKEVEHTHNWVKTLDP